MELVIVFETDKQNEIMVIKSVLDDANIPYLVEGENVQNLIGYGSFGTGFNPITGRIKVKVLKEFEQQAKEVLKGKKDE